MQTYFASPERDNEEMIRREADLVCQSPVLSGLLNTVGGVLAILNENRQIIAVNNYFLKLIGIGDPEEALGLRPGEILACDYSGIEDGGCGTSKYCSTCGAAIAIVSALKNEKPEKRICALKCTRQGRNTDVVLMVRAQPMKLKERNIVLLFLHDITVQQQRAALERTFFHDIKNILSGMLNASELMKLAEDRDRQISLSEIIHNSAVRMNQEVEIQRYLLENDSLNYQPFNDEIVYTDLIRELRGFIASHPSADGRKLDFDNPEKNFSFRGDQALITRILTNMLTNALEATEPGGKIRLWTEDENNVLIFKVWNSRVIPENIQLRIFQRNFSTKGEDGRGVGTYSMKLFGEKVLGGTVDFVSSEDTGTLFRFELPLKEPLSEIRTV